MKLIINTNILISALLKDSITKRILLSSNIEFYLPEYSLDEIKRHNKMISERSGLSENEIDIILAVLLPKFLMKNFG